MPKTKYITEHQNPEKMDRQQDIKNQKENKKDGGRK